MALGIVFALSAHAQMVTNGDFETGDFTGWTVNPDERSVIGAGSGAPGSYHGAYSGTFFASTGCVGANCIGSDGSASTAYMYEDLNTVVNATYTVSFAFASGGICEEGCGDVPTALPAATHSIATQEELLATFGGVTVVDLVDVANSNYQFYSQNIVAASTTTRLEFRNWEDPDWSALDNISVTLVTSTPSPAQPY